MVHTTARKELAKLGALTMNTSKRETKEKLGQILRGIPQQLIDQTKFDVGDGLLDLSWGHLLPQQAVAVLTHWNPEAIPDQPLKHTSDRLKELLLQSDSLKAACKWKGAPASLDDIRFSFHSDSPYSLLKTHVVKACPGNHSQSAQSAEVVSSNITKDPPKIVQQSSEPPLGAGTPPPTRAHTISNGRLAEIIASLGATNLQTCVKAESLGPFKKENKSGMRKALTRSIMSKYPSDVTLKALIKSLKKEGLVLELQTLGIQPGNMNVESMKEKLGSLLTETIDKQSEDTGSNNSLIEDSSVETHADAEIKSKPIRKIVEHTEKPDIRPKASKEEPPIQTESVKPKASTRKSETAKEPAIDYDNTRLHSQHSILEEAIVKLQQETNCHEATINLLLEKKETATKKQGSPNMLLETRLKAIEDRLVASEKRCLSQSKDTKEIEGRLVASEAICLSQSKEIKELRNQIKMNHEAEVKRCEALDGGFRLRHDADHRVHPTSVTTSTQTLIERRIQADMSKITEEEKRKLGHVSVVRRTQADMSKITEKEKRKLGHHPTQGLKLTQQGTQSKNHTGLPIVVEAPPTQQEAQPKAKPALLPDPDQKSSTHKEETVVAVEKGPSHGTTVQLDSTGLGTSTPQSQRKADSIEEKTENVKTAQQGSTNHELQIHASRAISDNRESLAPRQNRNHQPRTGDHKCLILHDENHRKLLPMTKRGFFIESHQAGSLKSLKSHRLEALLKKHAPGTVFIHLGIEDLQKYNDPEDLTKDFEELMDYILDETNVKICISSILKTNSTKLNDSIDRVNRSIFQYSNKLRRESQIARLRIFTYNNVNIDKEALLLDDGISLNDYGTTKLGLRIGQCLDKTQGRNQQRNDRTTSRHHHG